ncbi:ABC transporter permease [Salisediminibacterium beveridgei]|uniref:Hydroxymethylpyrimidine ABC transporter, transmembrane component n=1 Tax=Salisediminibacterium beveridgei TaxID=632773 RepID=A0A1D7QYG1_9BACI|nr:ABC transporter permease [Salisediminibacterium beveridgei]AOM84040.1 Hydroxymethylpyrimidine ABC transporter, transmembrane component [Salisediminibacterium beveridgei]
MAMKSPALPVEHTQEKKASFEWSGKVTGFLKQSILPLAVLAVFLGSWQLLTIVMDMPHYILPAPTDIYAATVANYENLLAAVWRTITSAVMGFALSVIFGIAGAIALASSKWVEKAFYPYVVLLQTIPIIAVAPIIVIWFGAGTNAIVIIAFLIGFFPMLSNTLVGLNSTDKNLMDLFKLYHASKFQTMWRLRLPAALPYIVAGLKISCTLATIGVIAGEYIAGIGGGRGGLGYAITVASSNIQTAYLFSLGLAASVLGITFFLLINYISKLLLRSWHESEMNH